MKIFTTLLGINMVLGFSGRIHSGKTTISQELSKQLNIEQVSFGDFVRNIAEINLLSNDRKSLQSLGQKLVDENIDDFCQKVLIQKGWNRKDNLIIDGIRHVTVLNKLKELVRPHIFYLIYVDASDKLLSQRDQILDEGYRRSDYEKHSTEKQVANQLRQSADLLIESDIELGYVISTIVNKISVLL